MSPDAKLVAMGNDKGTIAACNLENGKVYGSVRVCFQEVGSISFSPDGEHIVSGFQDRIVRIWNIKLIENGHRVQGVQDGSTVRNFSLSGDGQRVLVLTVDPTISMWNALTGNKIAQFRPAEDREYVLSLRLAIESSFFYHSRMSHV